MGVGVCKVWAYLDKDVACDVALVGASAHALRREVSLLPEFRVLKLWGAEEPYQLGPVLARLEVGEGEAELHFAFTIRDRAARVARPARDRAVAAPSTRTHLLRHVAVQSYHLHLPP